MTQRTDWRQGIFSGKRFFVSGRFDKTGHYAREFFEKAIAQEGGILVPKFDATVDVVVLKELTGETSVEKRVQKLNEKGASISCKAPIQILYEIQPVRSEVATMLAAGPEGFARLNQRFALAGTHISAYDAQAALECTAVDLKGLDLSYAPLWFIALTDSDLSQCRYAVTARQRHRFAPLQNCNLKAAQMCAWFGPLIQCDCRGARFSESNFSQMTWNDEYSSDFTEAELRDCQFDGGRLTGSIFVRADMSGSTLANVSCTRVNFRESNLTRITARDVDFTGSSFVKANLRGADLTGAILHDCDLTDADLTDATMLGASLRNSIVAGTNFTRVNFAMVDLTQVDMDEAIGLDAIVSMRTVAGTHIKRLETQLKDCENFRTCIHVQSQSQTIRLEITYEQYGRNAGHYTATWTEHIWQSESSQWEQTCCQFSDALLMVRNAWPTATPLPYTIQAQGTKTGAGAASLLQIAIEAWCEAFDVPVPTAEVLEQQREAARQTIVQTIRESFDLFRKPDGVKHWNNADKALIKSAQPVEGIDLSDLDLSGGCFNEIGLQRSSFARSQLSNAQLYDASYSESDFTEAKLIAARLSRSEFQSANFTSADLSGANLSRADLRKANLQDADLSNVDLGGAKLQGANLKGAKLPSSVRAFTKVEYDADTIFPDAFKPTREMIWKGQGVDPRVAALLQLSQTGSVLSADQFFDILDLTVDFEKLQKATEMLQKDRFSLYSESGTDHLHGIVKSQSDDKLVYACRLRSDGHYECCTQNLNICGGLRGSLCKHLLVLIVGLARNNRLDFQSVNQWIQASRSRKPSLDRVYMTELFLKYKGAEAGDFDWRPLETMPEDFYTH